MKKLPHPLFLARESYRRRRTIDAARLLPVVGLLLILFPMLWTAPRTSVGMIYLFAVWTGLIALTAFLARKLLRQEIAEETAEETTDEMMQRPETAGRMKNISADPEGETDQEPR